ncbi:MAG: 4-hydroxy-tetrahydrodipicolinate synthase, partial [Sphingobacteriia bacterium]
MTIQKQLRGTGVALITPFTKNNTIDFDALGKVIDAMIDGRVEYLVSL